MARVDYWDIETALRDTLITELGSATNAFVSAEVTQPMDTRPWVAIYLKNRVDSDIQAIAAGTVKKYSLEFSIWCWCWTANRPEIAAEARDDLVGKVEIAIMENRTLGGKVDAGDIHGGEFGTAEGPNNGTLLGGEVIYKAEVKATT